MNKHRYWNSNGAAQALYDEMEAAAFKYTKASQLLFHSYYRYYNDGDLPGWARSRWDLTRHSYEYGYSHRVLTEAGEEEFERRLTERIQIEHRRFLRTQRIPACRWPLAQAETGAAVRGRSTVPKSFRRHSP